MAKIIRITPELIEQCKSEFNEYLDKSKFSCGKISFSKTFDKIERHAKLKFLENAWWKMQLLISNFDSEVAWHGVAYRSDDESVDEYIISDILVYPQEVSGATVNTDQSKYQDWLYGLDDEKFNNLRMQGHSHVNMGTTPSGVDETHQEAILSQLEDDMFYIFLIWNKKNDYTIRIYDLKKNVLFESKDITLEIEGDSITDFLADAGSKVTKKTYQYSNQYFNGYKMTEQKKLEDKKDDTTKDKSYSAPLSKKSTPSAEKGKSKEYIPAGFDDYDDDPYGPFGYSDRGYFGY